MGIDSSEEMLERARRECEGVEFMLGDVEDFTPQALGFNGEEGVDLLFSNAVFHWLRRRTRILTIQRLVRSCLKPGGVLALQVPDNYDESSHKCMRETALMRDQRWSMYLEKSGIGELGNEGRPDLDPVESAEEIYESLIPWCESVDVWRSEYWHWLDGHREVVEWVRGTGLMPYLSRIPDEVVKEEFLAEYEERLRGEYGVLKDGKVALKYPRLFVVAVKKGG